MNDITKIFQESFNALKPLLMFPIAFISLFFAFRLFVIIIDDSLYTPLDFLSELKERIFYREKFTCRMDAEKCAVFEDESEIDIGEFKCSEHCEHYGKCVNCMFFDYEEDKYICGKCHHRQERRKLKPLEDVEK